MAGTENSVVRMDGDNKPVRVCLLTGAVSVRRDGAEYTCDPAAGTCTCAAGRFRNVERCRHLYACDVLSARGHL